MQRIIFRDLPPLDDSLAEKLLPGCNTLDQVREAILQRCNELEQTAKEQAADNAILDQLFKVTSFHHPVIGTISSRSWFSSSASPEPSEKETNKPANRQAPIADDETPKASPDAKDAEKIEDTDSDSDSDSQDDLSIDDLVKLVAEKDELLKKKQKEIEHMQDKVLRSYADMENIMERTRRESENSKKFAIQNFAKSLLDVADNLGRASAVVKDSFSKIDQTKDSAGAVPLLKTLLEGVEMTDKQLAEVFRKYGMEKYDPINEQFDPNRHYAVFQLADASKPPGTVAAVLKLGYTLQDRIIRPAEVGVTEETPNNETEKTSKD